MDFSVLPCEFPIMLLLIPGPVTTRREVREALCRDLAPWDNDFRAFLARLRTRILRLAGGVEHEHATLPLQGCGHFITEAAIRHFFASRRPDPHSSHRILRRPHDPSGPGSRPRTRATFHGSDRCD